jgi:putative hydrolase of the HAD superfamily
LAYKAVFFDAGSTLFEVKLPREERFALLAERLEFGLGQEEALAVHRRMYAAIFPDGFLRATTLEQERQVWLEFYRPLLAEVSVSDPRDILAQKLVDECNYTRWLAIYPEVHNVLGRLRGRFKLGVISNAPPSLPEGLEYLELATYFETIVVSALVGVQKPAPAIFQIALDRLGVAATEAFFVDDIEENVAAATALGLSAALIDRDDKHPQAACLRIRSLEEVLNHVSGRADANH